MFQRIRESLKFLFDRESFSWSAWSAAAYFRGFVQGYVAETSPTRLVRDVLGQSRPKFFGLKLLYHRVIGAIRTARGFDPITPALFALLATQHLTQYMHLIVDPSGALLGHIIEQTIAEPSINETFFDPEEISLHRIEFNEASRRG